MRSLRALIAGTVIAAAAGCAHSKPKTVEVVWPEPPDVPRIKFVRYFRAVDDVKDSGWNVFGRAILGTKDNLQVQRPQGIAISDDGQRVYVADALTGVIRVEQKERVFALLNKEDPINGAFGIALDAEENVYVSASLDKRVYVFDRAGTKLRAIGKELTRPTGIAVDRKRQLLYVVDVGGQASQNHRVLVYSLRGELLRTIGTRGHAPGQFNFPTEVALDPAGNVFVSDSLNFRIEIFDPNGNFLRTFGEGGDQPGTFGRIKGLAFDSHGNLYVVDSEHASVHMFDKELRFLMWFGEHRPRYEFLELPSPIAIDPRSDTIYIGDSGAVPRINVYQLVNAEVSPPTPLQGVEKTPTRDGASRPGLGDGAQTGKRTP